jgi:hypothetical protein
MVVGSGSPKTTLSSILAKPENQVLNNPGFPDEVSLFERLRKLVGLNIDQ